MKLRGVLTVLRGAACALLLAWSIPTLAQTPPQQAAVPSAAVQPAPATASVPSEAKVQLANRTVAVLRGSFLGIGPDRRAARAELALREILRTGGAGRITVQVEPQGHAVLLDGELVLVLVEADTDPLRAQTLAQASAEMRERLARALAETREASDLRFLLKALGLGALATAVAGLLVYLAWRVRCWAVARLARRVAEHAAGLRVAGAQLLQGERLAELVGLALRTVSALVMALIVFEWLSFVLRQFPYTRPWGEQLTAFLVTVAAQLGGGVLQALPDLVIAVCIFAIARGVVLLFRPFFRRVAAGGRQGGWLDADTARPTQRLFGFGVTLFAVVMAYPYLPGSSSEAFKGISVLLGLMITIGGSSLFSQGASGLVLMYSRTLRVGEYVRIGEHEGTVTEMGPFTTRLRTGLGEELTLPNALVLGTATKNYSRTVRGLGFVVDTVVTIGYDTPWRQVEAMLLDAARRTPGVLEDPAPQVFQTALSDFYPEYRLVCQASPSQPRPRAEVLSALHANIQDVFNTHGVQIMSPHYLGDPATPKVVAPASWHAAPARDPQAGR